MKKFLIVVIVLLIVAFAAITLTIDGIVKSNIENIGSEMTGTTVTVQSVSISPFTGQGTINGFRVANPGGYQRDEAFSVNELFISLDLFSIFSDEIVVHELIIDSPSVYVEQKLPENNLRTILTNIRRATPQETTMKAMVIDHFLMSNGTAELYTEIGGERTATVEISTIELHNVGRGGVQNAVNEVIEDIAEDIVEQALQAAVQSGAEQLRDAIRSLFD